MDNANYDYLFWRHHMKAKLLFLFLITLSAIVLIPGCNSSGQPIQAVAIPVETTSRPAVFSVSNLIIRPADSSGLCDIYNLGTDDEIIVSVTVTNNGSNQGNHDVTLNIDWVEVETKSVMLAAGDSIDVEFNLLWGTHNDGIYTVTIEGLQAIFGVG